MPKHFSEKPPNRIPLYYAGQALNFSAHKAQSDLQKLYGHKSSASEILKKMENTFLRTHTEKLLSQSVSKKLIAEKFGYLLQYDKKCPIANKYGLNLLKSRSRYK